MINKVKHFLQRRFRGFDDLEVMDLDQAICDFMVPRLRVLRGKVDTIPSGIYKSHIEATVDSDTIDKKAMDEWQQAIDQMITGFQFDDRGEGLELFAKHYEDLWH